MNAAQCTEQWVHTARPGERCYTNECWHGTVMGDTERNIMQYCQSQAKVLSLSIKSQIQSKALIPNSQWNCIGLIPLTFPDLPWPSMTFHEHSQYGFEKDPLYPRPKIIKDLFNSLAIISISYGDAVQPPAAQAGLSNIVGSRHLTTPYILHASK